VEVRVPRSGEWVSITLDLNALIHPIRPRDGRQKPARWRVHCARDSGLITRL